MSRFVSMPPRWVTLVLPIALLSVPVAVVGNGPEVGRNAGMVFPLRTNSIQLVSESVRVLLPEMTFSGRGKATCTYRLKNLTASRQVFEMAFVAGPLDLRGANQADYLDFNVGFRDGNLPIHFEAVDKEAWSELIPAGLDSIPVWEIDLGPNESAEVHMSYAVSWSGGGDDIGKGLNLNFTFYARPAAYWAGVVEKADITFAFLDSFLQQALHCLPDSCEYVQWKAEPAGWRWTEDGIQWQMSDEEPTRDFRIWIEWVTRR